MPAFSNLWRNHPRITGDTMPCGTKDDLVYPNQCAIRLGVCLQNSGVNTSTIPNVVRCDIHKESAGHILRAEELAVALRDYGTHFPWLGKTEEISPKDFKTALVKKKGIIFFKDYYRRKRRSDGKKQRFRDRSGDHIDLWNGLQLTDPRSLARIQHRIMAPGQSDLEQSKALWFWEIV